MAINRNNAAARRRKTSMLWRDMPRARIALYADVMLDAIREAHSRAPSFSREDLLHLPVFQHIGTISRYHYICLATQFLIEDGKLVAKTRTDLCLPERADAYRFDETRLQDEYHDTVAALVTANRRGKAFGVMDLVDEWKTDPQLTTDSKRKAVRLSMSRLIREGLCEKQNEFEYVRSSQRG